MSSLFAACLMAACEATPSEETTPQSPNVVLILSDDQGWQDYGFMGHEHLSTPNLDRLSAEGVTFVRGYVPTSLCAPSLASIATGLYPRQHGVLGNDRVLPGQVKSKDRVARMATYQPVIDHFESLQTLPDLLKSKGYRSYQTGKWWLGNYANGGFDAGMTHGDPARQARHGDYGLTIGRNGMDTLFSYVDEAMAEDAPFLLWYAPFLPHRPHNPPDSLLQKYLPLAPSESVARYWANTEWFDITCGQLIDYIEEKGEMDNTLFVYVCDNGWVQQEDKAGYDKRSKRSPYDQGMRTPIIYKWSGKIEPAFNPHSVSSSLDIVPTVLAQVGIEVPDNLDGIDALDPEAVAAREAIFGEIYAHDFYSVDSSLFYRIVHAMPYKLILPNPKNKPDEVVQLYNLDEDPHEEENLAEQLPEVVAKLNEQLESHWAKK